MRYIDVLGLKSCHHDLFHPLIILQEVPISSNYCIIQLLILQFQITLTFLFDMDGVYVILQHLQIAA